MLWTSSRNWRRVIRYLSIGLRNPFFVAFFRGVEIASAAFRAAPCLHFNGNRRSWNACAVAATAKHQYAGGRGPPRRRARPRDLPGARPGPRGDHAARALLRAPVHVRAHGGRGRGGLSRSPMSNVLDGAGRGRGRRGRRARRPGCLAKLTHLVHFVFGWPRGPRARCRCACRRIRLCATRTRGLVSR